MPSVDEGNIPPTDNWSVDTLREMIAALANEEVTRRRFTTTIVNVSFGGEPTVLGGGIEPSDNRRNRSVWDSPNEERIVIKKKK